MMSTHGFTIVVSDTSASVTTNAKDFVDSGQNDAHVTTTGETILCAPPPPPPPPQAASTVIAKTSGLDNIVFGNSSTNILQQLQQQQEQVEQLQQLPVSPSKPNVSQHASSIKQFPCQVRTMHKYLSSTTV